MGASMNIINHNKKIPRFLLRTLVFSCLVPGTSFSCNANKLFKVGELNQFQPISSFAPNYGYNQALFKPIPNYCIKKAQNETLHDKSFLLKFEQIVADILKIQKNIVGYVDSGIKSSSSIGQFTIPNYKRLSYTSHIHHKRLILAGKLLSTLDPNKSIYPYISGEIGGTFHKTSTPLAGLLITEPSAMASVANYNSIAFAYGIGLGVDYLLTPNVRLGTGYQFTDLGRLVISPTQTISQSLIVSHLYMNQLRFQLKLQL